MLHNHCVRYLLLCCTACSALVFCMDVTRGQQADVETTGDAEARDAVLNSPRWEKAKDRYLAWLGSQSVYSKDQIEALNSELRNRIAGMSADEMKSFLAEMEAKLDVLTSPATMEARRWASKYTDSALQRIRKEYGVEDPIRTSSFDLDSALQQFHQDRRTRLAEAKEFRRARETQAKAARDYHQRQANLATRAAGRPASTGQRSASSYAPRSPRSPRSRARAYSSPYPKLNYTIGPWGGVWVSPRR